ncbi:hypothetical protein A9762_12275 [Pandoraea sp. ISTKB]|nr:hypothetical protein A9762_12275 [Pandoraea sp. ISTKB]
MDDIFANQTFGKIALKKLEPLPANFMLYVAGWLGDGTRRDVMEVSGAVFREAKSGPRKGKLCVMVPGTKRTTYVTADEMDAVEKAEGLG